MVKKKEQTRSVILRCVVNHYDYSDILVPIQVGSPCLITTEQREELGRYIKKYQCSTFRDIIVDLVEEPELDELIEKADKKAKNEMAKNARRIAEAENRRQKLVLERKRKRLAKLQQMASEQG